MGEGVLNGELCLVGPQGGAATEGTVLGFLGTMDTPSLPPGL